MRRMELASAWQEAEACDELLKSALYIKRTLNIQLSADGHNIYK
jgi:hypothetical protein